jgi:Mg/Co/Ni transporter MgtE
VTVATGAKRQVGDLPAIRDASFARAQGFSAGTWIESADLESDLDMNTVDPALTLIATATAALSTAAERELGPANVGARASTVVVKVPCWFTAGAALRVAQLKRVEFLLVLDRGAVAGTVSRRVLAAAPASEPLGRWMTASTAVVSSEAPCEEAWRVMALQGLECLPVVHGPLLVGLVAREDLTAETRAAG